MHPKILLVDDREDNLLSIESILERDEYSFIKANSGRQALKILLNEYDFALILMDVEMPNLNGFETAALIYEREKLKHIPIIFITANSYGDENVYKGYRSGAVDYIYKPLNSDLLRAKVSVFVELYKKNHRLIAQEQKLITINKSLEAEINERKLSEEKIVALNRELLENIDRLEAANKELDRVAFMASHDLQEPLRKVRIFNDRLFSRYENVIDEEGKAYFKRIDHAAERMQVLIRDILTFSKLSTNKDLFVTSDLNIVLGEVLNELEASIKDKQAIVVKDELPHILANPGLIRLLFLNLLNNALKYSRSETQLVIKIHSDMREHQQEKYCRIFFEDNGIGFDQKHAEQIFQMFKRLHATSEYEGTGIGLALCKKIVEEHKGFISATSKVDAGSVFIVAFPVLSNQPVPVESKRTKNVPVNFVQDGNN